MCLETSTGMEASPVEEVEKEKEEEYVMLDLDSVSSHLHIPPNAPFVLSGLDTLNPMLVIDEKFKLIGEYEETIGTCLVFTEQDSDPVAQKETGPSEAAGKSITDPNHPPRKQVKPLTCVHKVLKFRLATDDEENDRDVTPEQARETE